MFVSLFSGSVIDLTGDDDSHIGTHPDYARFKRMGIDIPLACDTMTRSGAMIKQLMDLTEPKMNRKYCEE